MGEDALREIVGNECSQKELANGMYVLSIENAKFWFDKAKTLVQIGVTKGFLGKLSNCIGIGSTMAEVQKKYGRIYKEDYDYLAENLSGVAFELGDMEEYENYWVKYEAPIEWIYVYEPRAVPCPGEIADDEK